METVLDPGSLSRLKWRCRRGLLENDLFIERFFKRYEGALTVRHAADPGVAIASFVRESGADLLVMGAFGQSALREFFFGSVTRSAL